MDSSTRSFICGIIASIAIALAVSTISQNSQNDRITKLERQQAQLIEMLTYIPKIDVPEVVKTIRPKVIGKGAHK
jgi:hypothetical protein